MSAKSYKCEDCGAFLRTVKEAQDHGEATGHANFAESEEAVLTLVCVTCGKPCRSATEKDLHTTRTGHTDYVDKTAEQGPVNTEKDMKDLEEELKDDDGEASTAMDTDEPAEMVPVEVDAALLKECEEMGFSTNRATRAIYTTGSTSLEQVINWIVEHENDADIDEPMLVAKGTKPKVKLSPEEAKAQAAELLRKAKLKREKEEKEAERLREQERIRSGKELLEAKRKEQEQERKRIIEWRAREKREEAAAKEKIRLKLEEDRLARRRAQGLPDEYTEEELAKMAEKEAKKKAEEEQKKKGIEDSRPKPKPVTLQIELRDLLVKMKQSHPGEDERVTKAFNTMLTYLGNIARAPAEEKFRKINLGNAAFQTRVGSLTGGIDFLCKAGFVKDDAGEFLTMPPESVDMNTLNTAGGEISNALANPFFGVL